MSREQTSQIAQRLLAALAAGADPEEIAALFSAGVEFEIAGDVGALPWIGRRTGRGAVSEFIRDTRRMIESVRFDVQDVFTGEDRAVIVGELASRVTATGKMIESAFALVVSLSEGEITRFQMLEDSFAVSRAARA